MSATTPDTGQPTREVSTAAASSAAGTSTGAPPRRLGLALAVIATAQLMVVLDATIVNVALPHIQAALGFSGTNLEWVVNAYALAFGGLLLLGGRSGDLLGRRRVFIAGILLFSLASLLGGFATSQAWLLDRARPAGRRRRVRRAHRVVADRGHLPRGAAAQPRDGRLRRNEHRRRRGRPDRRRPAGPVPQLALGVLRERADRPGRRVDGTACARANRSGAAGQFDLPGAITGSLGLAALVYGLSSAATSPNGVSHWGDTKVIVSLVAAVVLLVAFGFIEVRSKSALVPTRVLRSRDRTGAYLISLCIGTALFGMFFFLTLFVQNVWGYSALKTGVSYLPMVAMIMVASAAASQLVNRIGARPLMITGSVLGTGGMIWLSRVTEHSTYAGGLLGPMLLTAAGMGLLFVPISLVSLTKVGNNDAGVASSLLNVGQQVGGALGLAILGTVAWSAVANSLHSQAAAAAAAAKHATVHLSAAQQAAVQKAAANHALAHGFSQGYVVSAGIMLLALIIAVVAIRVTREDLSGVNPMAAPAD